MNTTNPLQKIYQSLLKETKSKSQIRGIFKAMKGMYEQDNLPKEDQQEIEKILKQVEKLETP